MGEGNIPGKGNCLGMASAENESSEYSKWKFTNSPTFLELLEEFPSLRVSAGFLLSLLPILKPRFYSISSSQDHTPTAIHLTVAVLMYHTRDGQGPLHHGVCSTWLNNRSPKTKCPALCGRVQGGRMTPVFECRSPNEDHVYQEEMLEMARKGVLPAVPTAYSCLPGKPKVCVQDILQQQLASEVLRVLHKEPGHLYVCRAVCMAWDVARTLAAGGCQAELE
nr:nitric oxide synthase, inducible-like [Pan paniscus]